MRPWRWVFVIALVAGLVWAAWLMSRDEPTPTTSTVQSPSTTTQPEQASTTLTTGALSSSTTQAASREEEVKAILEDLWFGWFDAIYRKDEDALWAVVATEKLHDDGVSLMGQPGTFTSAPVRGSSVTGQTILLDRQDCLVVLADLDFSAFRGPGMTAETVSVLWPDERYGWRFATDWQHPDDLWLNDCDNLA
ncbi:MAG TPA: hypothetical protein VID03_09990, partial [Acidimicrobiia bacterium]